MYSEPIPPQKKSIRIEFGSLVPILLAVGGFETIFR